MCLYYFIFVIRIIIQLFCLENTRVTFIFFFFFLDTAKWYKSTLPTLWSVQSSFLQSSSSIFSSFRCNDMSYVWVTDYIVPRQNARKKRRDASLLGAHRLLPTRATGPAPIGQPRKPVFTGWGTIEMRIPVPHPVTWVYLSFRPQKFLWWFPSFSWTHCFTFRTLEIGSWTTHDKYPPAIRHLKSRFPLSKEDLCVMCPIQIHKVN